jgi:hypothetical protein
MRSSDYRAANVQIQIDLLVDHAAQLAAGPSANRHINIPFLSAPAYEVMQTCRSCEASNILDLCKLRFRKCRNSASYSRIQGSYLGLNIELFLILLASPRIGINLKAMLPE